MSKTMRRCGGVSKVAEYKAMVERADREGYDPFQFATDEQIIEVRERVAECKELGEGECPWWPLCATENTYPDESEVYAADGSRVY